jgi:hypothetical protein
MRINNKFQRHSVHDQNANLKHGPLYNRTAKSARRKIKIENLPEGDAKLPLME